ncbi:FAD-dependent oxidoreductase [Roseivirga sp. BDSF3-8]|uniref:FAD-dependent oxidoreductase n=1 Tax=Roseivirga sp. BDSF3-8 TaxID=3241598 RepID=UPI0035318C87
MAANKPIIFAIDDDAQVLRAIERDLRSEYRQDYRIMGTDSVEEALEAVEKLKQRGDTIALFVSDQRMPEMLGVEFLEKTKAHFPEARRVLLTAYSDTDAAIRAINEVRLDYYLMKPWDPPEEKLYPVLNELLEDWQLSYRPEFAGIKVIGHQYNPLSHEIKDFLAGNLIPYQWYAYGMNNKAEEWLKTLKMEATDLPVVLLEDGTPMKQPSIADLASEIGLNTEASQDLYDVAIIGAGPAGLAAAVYGGSEGLNTTMIEKRAPGGQAGTSSRIENYLGFPNGLSGSELARRAISQATRFGIEFISPKEVKAIRLKDKYKVLELNDGSELTARSIVITTGVNYRKLPAEGVDNFTGAGVYYGAATTEANSCKEKTVFVVGGGNSAGQGAVYLSQYARKVYIVIRKPDLTDSMSHYLIDQINRIKNIEVLGETEVVKACGEEHLEKVVLRDNRKGENREEAADSLFIFIGAKPYTAWLDGTVLTSDKGFLITGRELQRCGDFPKVWKLEREPFLLETSVPGIFAAGDVRSGAMNRIASAVGEGAMAIKMVHQYLGEV